MNSQPGGPVSKSKANVALKDILNRNGLDNRVPGSSDEGALLEGLVSSGDSLSA